MNAAASSCRTWMNSGSPSFLAPSAPIRPLIPSPGRPKTRRTPHSTSLSITKSETVVDIVPLGCCPPDRPGDRGWALAIEPLRLPPPVARREAELLDPRQGALVDGFGGLLPGGGPRRPPRQERDRLADRLHRVDGEPPPPR